MAEYKVTVTTRRNRDEVIDVVQLMLDRGVVFDSYAEGAAVGLKLASMDGRTVVASLDAFAQYAAAVDEARGNRRRAG